MGAGDLFGVSKNEVKGIGIQGTWKRELICLWKKFCATWDGAKTL